MENCETCGRPLEKLGLTPAQVDVLEIIRKYIEKHGYSPSMRELAAIRKQNVSGVHRHIEQLVSRGYITKRRWRRRTMSLL